MLWKSKQFVGFPRYLLYILQLDCRKNSTKQHMWWNKCLRSEKCMWAALNVDYSYKCVMYRQILCWETNYSCMHIGVLRKLFRLIRFNDIFLATYVYFTLEIRINIEKFFPMLMQYYRSLFSTVTCTWNQNQSWAFLHSVDAIL